MKWSLVMRIAWMMVVSAGVAHAGDAPAYDVKTTSIVGQQDAEIRCPSVCTKAGHGGWNGQWTNTPPSGIGPVCGCTAKPKAVTTSAKESQRSTQAISPPIAAAWMYMSDDQQYNTIPQAWPDINFKNVDVLYTGPAGVQADGTFGLYSSASTGDLSNRFKWLIQRARSQNPKIKIIVSQWWGSGNGIWGSSLEALNTDAAIRKYTGSVAAFLHSYLGVSGGVDGFDIDYESNNVSSNISKITAQIRTQLDALSKANGGRPFYLTASPATTSNLGPAVASLNFVNMQTYAGGSDLTPQSFIEIGLKPQQLLYGICPESQCTTPSVSKAESQYTTYGLAGIHLWRLNSDNYTYENQVQAQVYSFLHKP
ncbi:glycosyl hydrolase family 18 protein [Stigmatella aurantiaca]|nr:glycosyl hydrolase family 18 protein [Stigmatella aurantiaca]